MTKEGLQVFAQEFEQIPLHTDQETDAQKEEFDLALKEKLKDDPAYMDANELYADFKLSSLKKGEVNRRVDSITKKIFSDPEYFLSLCIQLDHLGNLDEEAKEIVTNIYEELERLIAMSINSNNLKLGDESLKCVQNLLEAHISGFHTELIENLIGNILISSIKKGNLKSYIDALHVLAHGAIKISGPDAIKKVLDIIFFKTEVLTDKNGHFDMILPAFYDQNLDVLRNALDVDSFISTYGMKMCPDEREDYLQQSIKFCDSLKMDGKKKGKKKGAKNRRTTKAFMASARAVNKYGSGQSLSPSEQLLYDCYQYQEAAAPDVSHGLHESGDGISDTMVIPHSNYKERGLDGSRPPLSLIYNQDQVSSFRKDLMRRMVLDDNNPSSMYLYAPGSGESLAKVPPSQDARCLMAKSCLDVQEEDGQEITTDSVYETVSLLFPEIDAEKKKLMEIRLSELKYDLSYNLNSLVSPRGDILVIEDEQLQDLGIKSINFKPQESATELKVILEVGRNKLALHLDSELNLCKSSADEKKRDQLILSEKARLVVSELVLSHLRAIYCRDKAESSPQLVDKRGVDTEFYRRAHLRRLPVTQGFTSKQALIALEAYKLDLRTLNGLRGLDGNTEDTRQLTLVSEAVSNLENLQNLPPIKSNIDKVSQILA